MALAGRERKPALTAAASKIRYDRSTPQKLKDADWQVRAWTVYDKLGAVYYMTRYRAHIARKVEYFAAIDEIGMDPQVDDGPASKVLEAEGGPELIRRLVSELMVHWDVPGEAYLVRYDEEPLWRILSTQELKKTATGAFVWGDEQAQVNQGEIDPDNVYRVWQPHPRFHWEADSPTRHILDDAEELILSSREIKARTMSRLSAGILWVPDTVEISPMGTDTEGSEDDFAMELTRRMTRPIHDTGSADSLVPWVITADRADIEAARHQTFAREWEVDMDLREESRRNIALGLDLPPELGTGAVGDVNHWGAWWISDEAVNTHVAPSVDDILDSLTVNWFRPLLEAAGASSGNNVLWRDLSPATVAPDQSQTAIELFKLGAISGTAVRRVTNFDEDDAPDEPPPIPIGEEEELPANEEPEPPIQASIDWLVQEVAKRLKEGDPPLAEAAVTAAVARRVDAKPLADIDRELLAWLVEETQKEIDSLLGVVEKTLTAATDPLDESLLSRFRSRVDKKIAEAQERARRWVEGLTGRPAQFEDEEQTRGVGLDLIIGGVLEAIRRRLFTPSARPDPIDVGDLPDTLPPIDVLRRGLSVAGGGEPQFDDQATIDMIGNGQRIHDELSDNGFRPELMVWRTGAPSHPFDPHQRLEGVEFESWDSPKLAVTLDGQWISGSHYRPGDHRGCQCSVEQVLIQQTPITEQAEGEAITAPEADIHTAADIRAWADRNGLKVRLPREIPDEYLPAIRQAIQAIDDMRAKFPLMQGSWDVHPNPFLAGRQRGLVDVSFQGRGPVGAGAYVTGRTGVATTELGIVRFDLAAYAKTGRVGQTVSHNVYEAVVHEMGHVMDWSLGKFNRASDVGSFTPIIKKAWKAVWPELGDVADDLSNYALNVDPSEFFAEAFVARNAPSAFARLTPEAAARLNRFAEIVNQEARQLYGITEDVI